LLVASAPSDKRKYPLFGNTLDEFHARLRIYLTICRVDFFFEQWQLLPFSSGHTPLPSGPEQPQSLHSFAAAPVGGVLLALPTVNAHRSTINGIVKTFLMMLFFCL
jgi:hypothetical protein